jgi:hypothetical protein
MNRPPLARPRRPAAGLPAALALVGGLALATSGLALAPELPLPARDLCRVAPIGQARLPGPPPRLPGLGGARIAPVSADADVQAYFDQGIALVWGFNFGEALRAFREASRRDPRCALCAWGEALALGPSINHDMTTGDARDAYAAIVRARSLATGADGRTRLLIEVLAKRHAPSPTAPRPPLDRTYEAAARSAADAHPADADLHWLAADALANLHPRDYWRADGSAQPWTAELSARLDRALAASPRHPGALHLKIHAWEDAPDATPALAAADLLPALAPGAGHLVHMPSHVYFPLGRYHDAVVANRDAVTADRAYLELTRADPDYAAGYVLHNVHYQWAAAMLSGESAVALAAAQTLALGADKGAGRNATAGTRAHFRALPHYAMWRFGRFEALRAAPRPQPAHPYTDGVWRATRGIARLRGGDATGARADLEAARTLARQPGLDTAMLKETNRLSALLAIAVDALDAELAAADGDTVRALTAARHAATIEDGLERDEPPAWHVPARHTQGALELAAGRARDAEETFRADLARRPSNGYALAGLAAALRAQGRDAEATATDAERARAFIYADLPIDAPRF